MISCGTNKSLPSVPRSKGCLTCVARKTRCDGRRPTCQACQDRKQICRGYRRQNIVFLNDGWRAPGVARKERKKTATKPKRTEAPNALSTLTLQRNPDIDRSHLHAAFFLSQFATQLLGSTPFMASLFRHYFSLSPSHLCTSTEDGLVSSMPVVLAVDALSQGHFGKANADPVSVQQSFCRYGMALRSMSAKLSELQLNESTFQCLSEDDWQHMAFFCIVMAFWELKMSPNSHNWQKHIRGLADTIVLRGTDHVYSNNNIKLLATSRLLLILQTLSSRQPNIPSDYNWKQTSPILAAWRSETRPLLINDPNQDSGFHSTLFGALDSLMTDIAPIVDIMARYDKLLAKIPNTAPRDYASLELTLADLYEATEAILQRIESLRICWNLATCEIPLATWLSCHQEFAVDSRMGDQLWFTLNSDFQSLFDTVLSFHSMGEYHAVALYWTTIMTLHIFMTDMLGSILTIQPPDFHAQYNEKVEQHRAQLMRCTQEVLKAIAYASLRESRATAPFFMATAFQMAIVTLEREKENLEVQGNEGVEVCRVETMRKLAEGYLDWAMENKIPIKLDITYPHQWAGK